MNNFDIDINIDVKVENNSMKRLLLKKSLDKMFNNFNTLTAVPSNLSPSSNSNSSSITSVALLRPKSEKPESNSTLKPEAAVV